MVRFLKHNILTDSVRLVGCRFSGCLQSGFLSNQMDILVLVVGRRCNNSGYRGLLLLNKFVFFALCPMNGCEKFNNVDCGICLSHTQTMAPFLAYISSVLLGNCFAPVGSITTRGHLIFAGWTFAFVHHNVSVDAFLAIANRHQASDLGDFVSVQWENCCILLRYCH